MDIMRWMLAAGELPDGVRPWAGYKPVDVEALFGGLKVHERLREHDPHLGGLLQQARFVIFLGLGGATSGAKLEATIISKLADIAGDAFGEEAEEKVLAAPSPEGALSRVIRKVPAGVPIAVLVDEVGATVCLALLLLAKVPAFRFVML
jgi:hypothetical protein